MFYFCVLYVCIICLSSEKNELKDDKKIILHVIGFLIAMELFGVCLQEVHIHGKELHPLHRHFELPIIMSVVDIISLLVILKVESCDGLKKHGEGLIVTFISHACLEYLFNFWYIYSRNESFSVGYFEPVVAMLLMKTCTKTEVSAVLGTLLACMSVCAGFISGRIGILFNANRNSIIIFLVILFVSMRNISLQRLHEENVTLKVRKSVAIPYAIGVICIAVVLSAFHLTFWALPVMFAVISVFASVSTLYFTSVLLEKINVLSAAVLGLVSQICVNIICIPVEHAHNIVISIIGTFLLSLLVVLYFQLFPWKVSQDSLHSIGKVSSLIFNTFLIIL